MASSFSRHPRPADGPRNRLSITSLPQYSASSSAVQEKYQRHPHLVRWWIPVALPIPGLRTRRLRLFVPNVRQMHYSTMARFGRKRGSLVFCFALALLCFMIFALGKRFGSRTKQWPTLRDPPTLVFKRDDIQRIWEWEVNSGHYPSRQPIPAQVRLKNALDNPALPARSYGHKHRNQSATQYVTETVGQGSRRIYLRIEAEPPNVAYPPRPVPGSVADLDVVMEHCDFTERKYVRDCLEVLRVGAGLDNGKRVRRTALNDWKYVYVERPDNTSSSSSSSPYHPSHQHARSTSFRSSLPPLDKSDSEAGLVKKWGAEWEVPPLALPPTTPYTPSYALDDACDPEKPRIFHMFWTGRFTDKPYLAILSFLYTQNLGLHQGFEESAAAKKLCRPQFWMWINPGPAAAATNANALGQMYDGLKESPWASPFLHPRFKDVIKFKLWNTTEMLDNIDELKDEWRGRDLFNSGGWVINVPKDKDPKAKAATDKSRKPSADAASAEKSADEKPKTDRDDLTNRAGSKSASSYDRLSVILSDMARFILCHRFGGVYLDADTIFLRDWEELLSYSGAFAYRWSRLPTYNTAVLKLNKGSALGSFLFKTAVKNGLDFHPMTVGRYTKEAMVEQLLRRLPDALFDSAWLNTEDYQMDRPPQPFFTSFENFFEPPSTTSAAPAALGFDGFFKGAYSYHFHNFWWKPFDPARNWPDLGPRFANAERKARKEAREAALAALAQNKKRSATTTATVTKSRVVANDDEEDDVEKRQDEGEGEQARQEKWSWSSEGDEVEEDVRDLSWATVLKRTFEGYLRGERPNMYGEWLDWRE